MASYFSCCDSKAGGNDVVVQVPAESAMRVEPVEPAPGGLYSKSSDVLQEKATMEQPPKDTAEAVAEVPESALNGSSRWSEARKAGASEAPGATKGSDEPLVKEGEDVKQFDDWSFTVDKGADPKAMLGLSLTFYYSRLAVVQEVLCEGLVKKYNDEHAGEASVVRTGDVLLAVNGVQDNTDKMFNAFKQATSPNLSFRRVRRFEAVISNPGANLGIVLREKSQEVAQVTPGSIKDYNKACESGFQILPNDKIVAVNDKRTAAQELAALSSNGASAMSNLRLLIIRGTLPEAS